MASAIVFGVLAALLLTEPAHAVQPDEVLDDLALEARARTLSLDIRCLVCQNQSIDDSNAELARDLRIVVRERLVAGNTDEEVLEYLVDRYGPFVLLEPPKTQSTFLLWYGPAALLALGAIGSDCDAAAEGGHSTSPAQCRRTGPISALLDGNETPDDRQGSPHDRRDRS